MESGGQPFWQLGGGAVNSEDRIQALQGALRKVEAMQPRAIETMRRKGLKFDNSGGLWEKLAFALYTDLCEANWICRGILEEDET
jgi:hypothetical protein